MSFSRVSTHCKSNAASQMNVDMPDLVPTLVFPQKITYYYMDLKPLI